MVTVTEIEYQVLTGLAGQNAPLAIPELAEKLKLDQAQVSAVCVTRAGDEIELVETPYSELRLGKKAGEVQPTFPERLVVEALEKCGGEAELSSLAEPTGLDKKAVGQSLRWLKAKGWAEQEGRLLKLLPAGRGPAKGADEALVEALAELGSATEDELRARGLDVEAALKLLDGRSGVLDRRDRVNRIVSLTSAGQSLVDTGLKARREVTQLTPELLRGGEWREVELRPYDVTLAAEPSYPGKEHPLVSIFQMTRRVFLELGFEETQSGYVESSFWDFDALFQPQDHPARDMQDTFYVERPDVCRLPDQKVVEAVGQTHRDGGTTGSVGWRYDWDVELTKRPVLRTHTTASTIRALADNPVGPRKVFCVGPVFRRETVDYKHLPVFHQVDGIIIDPSATFANLLGTLKAFYSKMGFDRFQFRPAFFPYTEPSVEIFVWSEKKGDWVEMGGAGMFRPEVTRPLGCTQPVLAWGLGLERLAMFRYSLGSIGELYRARMQWLKETPLCR
ncbi:MAG: phenylalanine--tRNA ligase subunit alpha [Candidatus Eremiobacteraeota bacterium]|nr:phenylalanine--tRNA ligase subunit alpha [Candidatus Eremiobacteraeota bacterium]